MKKPGLKCKYNKRTSRVYLSLKELSKAMAHYYCQGFRLAWDMDPDTPFLDEYFNEEKISDIIYLLHHAELTKEGDRHTQRKTNRYAENEE